MKSYLIQTGSVFKDTLKKDAFSLSSKDYRQFQIPVSNTTLSKLIQKYYHGEEIGSSSYMKHSKYRFLKTVNLTNDFCVSEEVIEYCRPENKTNPKHGDILIAKDGGGNGLGESVLYNLDNTDKRDSISAGILGIRLRIEDIYYTLAFLKSQHFKDFIDLNTPQGSTIRHSKKIALDYPLPLPTTNNYTNTKKVKGFVSLVIQNIIDKEEQIKIKNSLIDKLIYDELRCNQNDCLFEYHLPKISEVKKQEFRMDSTIYGRKLKQILFQINNYKFGSNTINELGFKIKRGQNLQITCIGESYYSSYQKSELFNPLITSTNINFSRQITNIRYIGNKNKLIKIRENDIMVAATGVNTGKVYIFPEIIPNSVSNINSFFLNSNNDLLTLFVGLFLSYLSKFNFCKLIGSKSNGGSILDKDISDFEIPNFPESKQEEIARQYHNPLAKNANLNSENYLANEKLRNSNVGIFQLNMEIFSLREKVEDIVDNIIKGEIVDTLFNY